MVLEQTMDAEKATAFDIQAYFNSTQNHELECPFCPKKAEIILNA